MISVVNPDATTPPTLPRNEQEVDLLLRFVHERDVLCYNLRNLTQPVCPECRETLTLKVDVQPLALAPLLIALVPGAFCAVAVGIFIVMSMLHGPPSLQRDTEVWLVVGFFAISAAVAIAIVARNRAFMRLAISTQVGIGAAIWVVHLIIFLIVATSM